MLHAALFSSLFNTFLRTMTKLPDIKQPEVRFPTDHGLGVTTHSGWWLGRQVHGSIVCAVEK